jgi:hypothetical protein
MAGMNAMDLKYILQASNVEVEIFCLLFNGWY